MDINLYYPDCDNELITFIIPNTYNSVIVFIFSFKIKDKTNIKDINQSTKLVSGYEKKFYGIDMTLSMMPHSGDSGDDDDENKHVSGYIVSCVRLPFICTQLVVSGHFTDALSVAIVQIKNETQIWHIFGVKKHTETNVSKKIIGVYINENGRNVFYRKELIKMEGSVPAAFMQALIRPTNNVMDLDLTTYAAPQVKRKECDVTLIHK
ncbi:ac146 [Hemileuca sp. nucleopolyhedrovirus]|uniref:Ac146 n=1 Tax=Hemileuca sp. nucleopolyhedrovirus TaxID=1367203 RepID=S5MJZ0_9ABAC|nr:ac146 [Hemileuca sp. nucleopolyhedrovirus]AGR56766.1 ac146 [Hemileuca sp. nucleopolyhedrovirus]